MDAQQPPNDNNSNNNNNNNNNNNYKRGKLDRLDNNDHSSQRTGNVQRNENGEIDVFGDLRDQDPIIVLFIMGVLSYMLRSRCIC